MKSVKKFAINDTLFTFLLWRFSSLLPSSLYWQEGKFLGGIKLSSQITEKWSPSKSPPLHSDAKDDLQFHVGNTRTL